VAQAYIADVTTPETRARGMGLIGMGFGLGFIFGPFLGGELGHYQTIGGFALPEGALAAFAAAGLSVINFVLALLTLPESLEPTRRGKAFGRRRILDLEAMREVSRFPGLSVAIAMSFFVIFWFSGMEATFRLFTKDAFDMSIAQTGRVFAFVGVVGVIVQGGLIHRLTRRFGEVKLMRVGLLSLAIGFALDGLSAGIGAWFLFCASAFIALGSGLYNPSLTSYSSRQASVDSQGLSLGVVQSMSALARAMGPPMGGLAYETLGIRGPYFLGALGLLAVVGISFRLAPLAPRAATSATAVAEGG
jgi:DHA1 family tetracycline resistance protein-like MFS transporter